MHLQLLPVDAAGLLGRLDLADISFNEVRAGDSALPVAYASLAREFAADTLDDIAKYHEWLDLERRGAHPFPFLMVLAVWREARGAYLLGVLNGNLMPVLDASDSSATTRTCAFAIGYQVTDAAARGAGVRGIGRSLWERARSLALSRAASLGWSMVASVAESEDDAVGYWRRLGFRHPRGLRYWQPPLAFAPDGSPQHPPVPLHLMFRPEADAAAAVDRLSAAFVLGVVKAIYTNWSLSFYADKLAPEAFARAESFVMGELYARVCAGARDPVELVSQREGDQS